jgi:CheY-like chemotaxis protein/HPt (histidine-containing phosphotransfer) domain-containing protein
VPIADNGSQAVDQFQRGNFDLVLMDVQMPVMDGFAATAAIRNLERGTPRRTPIVAMTAHAMVGDRERCLAAGMDTYLAKPIDVQQLIEVVEGIAGPQPLPRPQFGGSSPARETSARVSSGNGRSAPGPASGNFSPELSAADGIMDVADTLRRLGGDRRLWREMLEAFADDAPTLLADIERAADTRDAAAVERAAHRLRGLGANVGAGGIVECATRLERMGAAVSLDGVESEFARLQHEMERLERILHLWLGPAAP